MFGHITDATVPLDSASRPRRGVDEKGTRSALNIQPALWHTREFYVYYVLLIASIVSMLLTTTGFSSSARDLRLLIFHCIRNSKRFFSQMDILIILCMPAIFALAG